MNDDFHDPLEEAAPPQRDGKGRFRKGSSGNRNGRGSDLFAHDPSLPASRRKIISKVADELVEVKVNGKPQKMTLFEANVRALAVDGTRNRVAAHRFIDLATNTSQQHLNAMAQGYQVMEQYQRVLAENEQLRRLVAPTTGVMHVPVDDLLNWPPPGLIDGNGNINMEMVRELRDKDVERRKRQAEEGSGAEGA